MPAIPEPVISRPARLSGPIVIFSFDRPQYLGRLCASLRTQRRVEIRDEDVYLLQDGAVSPHSGVRMAEDDAIAACIAAFREHFPGGKVMHSTENLGIAFNIRRGEKLVFETLDSDVGYFFEDDLEAGPLYMHMMEEMYAALRHVPRMGYFAAYGDQKLSAPGPEVRLIPLAHNWGFGLLRGAWRQIDAKLSRGFYKVLEGRDYGARNHFRLHDLMRESAVATSATSQDAFKAMACAELGLVRVRSDVCFARYIGEHGVHFTPKNFEKHGFRDMMWVDREDVALAPVDGAELAHLQERTAEGLRRFRQDGFEAMAAAHAEKRYDEDRLVTREDVEDLYRLLLDKRPHGEAMFNGFVGKRSLKDLRRRLVFTDEFRSRNPLPDSWHRNG
ncbi:hypothetical protein ACFOD4_02050 [Pseudoroseomonas globiformis]|uniref:Glycosyltransferase family 2 protein n=1 Tax=Teichococcus globiformis TaxID=2307229 RepID=A0ABV7FU04_9PROT